MAYTTRVLISLRPQHDCFAEDLRCPPGWTWDCYRKCEDGVWRGALTITGLDAPAEPWADLIENFAALFPDLLHIKGLHRAEFSLEITVGPAAPEPLRLSSNIVALFAALGAPITIVWRETGQIPTPPDAPVAV